MEEVNNLLREAWKKAYERGIVLRIVNFTTTKTYCDNIKLHGVNFDAELRERNDE